MKKTQEVRLPEITTEAAKPSTQEVPEVPAEISSPYTTVESTEGILLDSKNGWGEFHAEFSL